MSSRWAGPRQARGQMEILGLAIIVVLVMLGVLFAIQFVLRAPSPELVKEYKESELAASLITTILSTTTPCNKAKVTELLQDCAVFHRLRCPAGDSCAQAQEAIGLMLQGTLGTWKRAYEFKITGAFNVEQITFSSGDCSGEKESNTNPVPTAGGPLYVTLSVCS